jgi:phospholipase C
VPAIVVSPWVAPGSVYNEEYRHTSLLATLRKVWGLGDPFTQRDASAGTFEHVFTLDRPRAPESWATFEARPVPPWTMDPEVVGKGLSALGKTMGHGLIARAREMAVSLPRELDDPAADLTPKVVVDVIREVACHFFPLLAGDARDLPRG